MNLVGKKFAVCGHPEFAEQVKMTLKLLRGIICRFRLL